MKAAEKPAAGKRSFPAGEWFAAAFLLAATFFGCFFLFAGFKKPISAGQTAMLTETQGLRILSENPAPVKDGTVSFSVALEEGYRFSDLAGGRLDGETLSFRTMVGSSYTITLARPVTLSLADSQRGRLFFIREEKEPPDDPDAASEGSALPEVLPAREIVLYTDETAAIRGESADPEQYSFCGVTADGTLYPADDDGTVRAKFPDDARLEPVFLGREVAVRISCGPRGRVVEGDGGDMEEKIYRFGDVLPLCAQLDGKESRFLGWSRGGYLRDGGELVSKSLRYEWELLGDSELYANFEAITRFPLRFSAGDGSFAPGKQPSEALYGQGDYVSLPVDEGQLLKEGFRCVGFTESPVTVPEEPDAAWLLCLEAREDFHSFGGMLLMPGRPLTLHPVFVPETDPSLLEFSGTGRTAKVIGFSSAGQKKAPSLLVLPARSPNGEKVTAIAENAFASCKFLEKADIPAGVQTLSAGAFRACVSLRSLTLPETVQTLSKSAFEGCEALARLLIHPTCEKVFDVDYDSALADKYLRLLATENAEKRLILVGGSGCAYGYDSDMLESAFDGCTVVNLGTAVNYGIRPLLSILECRCKKGDVVLFSPEYRQEMYGTPAEAMTSWQFLESNYDILRDIDLRKNRNLLSSYESYLSSKRRYLSSGKKKYNSIVYSRASFDFHGDLIAHRPSNLKPFESYLPGNDFLTEEGLAFFRESLFSLRKKGVRCLYSFPMLAEPQDVTVADIRRAEEDFLAVFLPGVGGEDGGLTVISRMEDLIFPTADFYDSMYHATLGGAKRRTAQVIEDLRPYLSPGKEK